MSRLLAALLLLSICRAQPAPTSVQFVKSLSGPSGKVIGAEFVLDETRTRFVYPQDRTMVATFLWNAPLGDHTMTAVWKGPDGRVVYISPDVRVQTQLPELRGYWVYELYPTTQPGFWTLEVRVDGQPAGTHNFELVIPAQQQPAVMSVGDVYRSTVNSVVWVHAVNADGRRAFSSNGFVVGKDRIATAFQAIDSASTLEIEFANGRVARTQEIWNANRLQDWAVIKADTQDVPALASELPTASFVGERLMVYNVEERATRAFGGVDITGVGNDAVFGPRVLFSPRMPAETSGGPLLSPNGKVVGIVGGTDRPGARFEINNGRTAYLTDSSPRSATPMALVTESPSVPTTLQALLAAKTLTIPVVPHPNFMNGTTMLPNLDPELVTALVTDFSRKDTIVVRSQWSKRSDQAKGTIGARIYDAQNRVIADVGSKATTLNDNPIRYTVSLKLATVLKGTYRVDMEWNDQPVWRTFVTIID